MVVGSFEAVSDQAPLRGNGLFTAKQTSPLKPGVNLDVASIRDGAASKLPPRSSPEEGGQVAAVAPGCDSLGRINCGMLAAHDCPYRLLPILSPSRTSRPRVRLRCSHVNGFIMAWHPIGFPIALDGGCLCLDVAEGRRALQ